MKTNRPLFFRSIALILVMLLSYSLTLFSQPQHYNYNTNGTNNSFPLGIAAGKNSQWLYLAGEFNQPTPAPAGTITKFWFRVGDTYPINATYTTFELKMGQSTITTLPTGAYYTPMTTVFARASYQIVAAGGTWFSITLDTPFPYNPAQSLIVEMGHCGGSGATGFPMCTTTLGTGRRNWSVGGCPFVYSSASTSVANIGLDISTVVNCNYSWATQTSGVSNLFQAVWAPSGLVCWVGGAAGTVRKTIDGGTTWTNGNPNPGVITGDIYNVWALDANTAILTTSPAATFIYRTTNGGTNWTQVFTQAGGFIDAIVMTNATTGYAYGDPVGARWSLWKTVNGGATWDSTGMYLPQAGSEAGWNNAMSVVGSNIWFGTNNTRVYRSTNGGATGSWTFAATTGNLNTYGVWFRDANNGMCVGTIAQITTNGGANWTNAGAVGGSGNMTSVGGLNDYFWLTRGTNTYGTTNFGSTWTGTGYTGTQALWASNFTTAANGCYTGWAVGAAGTIVKLTGIPVGIGNNNTTIPSEYNLEQNYPNPFNPVTSINFAIPKAGLVDLKVFDVLGREVAVVMNGYVPAGNHTAQFDASTLSSGVYFYTLTSGEFTSTKKMLLVK
jgi:Secretion system C-terminal sorting domain